MEINQIKLAFAGPSGLGKTTLCKYLVKELHMTHLSTSASDIVDGKTKRELTTSYGYKWTGHKDVINLSSTEPEFGRAFQTEVLLARVRQIRHNPHFVIDRSPIDNVVYLLTQGGHNMTEQQIDVFIKVAQEAYQKLTHVVMIKYSNDIPSIEDNHSRVANRFFQQYISDVFMGVYLRYFAHIVGPRVITLDFWSRAERQNVVKGFLSTSQEELKFEEK